MSDDPIKVLLVEDNPGDARLIWEMLTDVETTGPVASTFDLECTDRLSTGLEHLAAGDIDVVLLDLSLPDNWGLDTFVKVHARAPQVPIIVLTALNDEALAVEAVREGAQDYLVKGQVDSHLLVRAMRYAIERKRAEGEIKRRNEELAALNAIATAVSQSLDLREILDAALEKTLAVLNVEGGLIYLFDETSQTFASAVHRGISQDVLRQLTGFKMGEGLSGWVAESGEALVVADLSTDPRNISPASSQEGWRSYAGVPIKFKGKVLGVITLSTRQEGYFRPDHIDLLSHIGNQIGVAVENAQLFGEMERRLKEMTALYQISLDITARLEVPELLKSIVERAVTLLRAEAGGIYLYDPEREELRLAIGHDYAEKYIGVTLKPGEGMAGKVFQIGEPLIVDDYRTWEGRAPMYEADQPFTAMLEVPLKWQERIIGVLAISADVQERTFNQDDIWLATLFANQAAVTIENARLYQETVRRLEETEALGAVTTALTRSLDLDQVLQSIVDSATRLISTSTGGVIHLVDEAAGKLIPRATSVPEVNIQEKLEMSIGEGIAGLVMQEKRLINVSSVEEDPRFLTIDTVTPKKSLLTAPLMMGDRCLGTISLHSNEANAFTRDDEWLLSTLASQAAIAVENARLYEKVTERMIEATLLHKVSNTLIRTLNLERLLEDVLEVLQKAFGYSHCAILLPDKETEELYVKAARGYLQAAGEGLRIKIGQEGITGWVAANRVPLNVSDVTKDDRYRKWVEGTQSEIAVPMLAGEQVVGVLDVQSTEVNAFGEDDLRTLSSVAAQAAIAIERARLFQEARELDRMKSDFVSNVSHELRTPLANIKLYAALAQKGRPEKRQHYLAIIEGETERLEALIEDILDLSRLERGAVKLQMEPLPLAEIVQQVVGAHLATAQAKGIELAWQVPDGLPTLHADRTYLLLMLNNLLGNALQYTPRGGSVWVEARAGEWRGQPALHIAVHDTGMGIPADEQERIFERFYRGRRTPVGTTGTGLGLAIVKESMALHGGEATVKSAVGQGSTFILCFPLEREVSYA